MIWLVLVPIVICAAVVVIVVKVFVLILRVLGEIIGAWARSGRV